jgi:hypothetical protein
MLIMNPWQRWVRQPQKTGLRRAVLQVHRWSGIGLGLYIFFISVTGSVLVYRNELYVAALPSPTVDEAQTDGSNLGFWLVSQLIELHASLLAGPTGRAVNGLGAAAVVLMVLTGLVIWWPGIRRWRRSLTVRRGVGWKRLTWDLHSAIGFWSSAVVLVFALSGLYLCFPEVFHTFADRLEPPTAADAGNRFVDAGSRSCTSAASTALAFRATAPVFATSSSKPRGRCSAWPPPRCSPRGRPSGAAACCAPIG